MSPCKDCTDRHLYCHQDCAKYKKWIDSKSAGNKLKKQESDYCGFHYDNICRCVRR